MIEIPWWQAIEVTCGLFTGFVYARTAHLFHLFNARGHKSHCDWCGGNFVDLRDPGAPGVDAAARRCLRGKEIEP